VETITTIPVIKEDKITLFDGLNITVLMIWFFTAFMTWGKAEELTSYHEEYRHDNEYLADQSTRFNVHKDSKMSWIHEFWYEYYTPSGEYDYTDDRFGDHQGMGPGLGTFITWVLAVICYSLAFALGTDLDKKITWKLMVSWIIIIVIPLALTYSKWEFLYWISH
jgi:hypothetical protein